MGFNSGFKGLNVLVSLPTMVTINVLCLNSCFTTTTLTSCAHHKPGVHKKKTHTHTHIPHTHTHTTHTHTHTQYDSPQNGAKFFVAVYIGSGAHPSSFAMATGSFPGVKRPERGVDHPPLLAPRLRKE